MLPSGKSECGRAGDYEPGLAGNGLASEYSWQFTTVGEAEIVQQPTPNNWGWIAIIILLISIIMLLLYYQFDRKQKGTEPEETEEPEF